MQSYRSILTGLHAAIAGMFGIAAAQHDAFIERIPNYGRSAYLVTLLGLFLLFRYSSWIADLIIEKIPGFSFAVRRMMSGHDCIEGDWPLVVVDAKTGKLSYFGFLTITYTSGQLKVAGCDWNPDDTFAHEFESQQSRYSGNLLQYWYHQGEDARMRGYTEIYFFPKGEPVERHSGEFLDKQHNAARFYARRLTYKRFERRPKSEKDRLAAAHAFWASIEPRILNILSHPVSADWE